MSEMRLVVVGAAGRMGSTLVRTVNEMDGVVVSAAIERENSEFLGKDAGELAECGKLGVEITSDLDAAFAEADGVLDFTIPEATVMFAEAAARHSIVHIIGTTGMTSAQSTELAHAATSARIVKSGNMSLGVNLLAGLVKKAAAALDEDFDIEVLEMHHKHKLMHHQAQHSCLARQQLRAAKFLWNLIVFALVTVSLESVKKAISGSQHCAAAQW